MSITKDLLEELFEYKDGHLFYKNKNRRTNKVENGDMAGGLDFKGYRNIKINGKLHKEHRLIFFIHHGYFPVQIDHINQIKDDNRIENLREANNSQNKANSGTYKNSVLGFRGIKKKCNKYSARIQINKKRIHLGSFETIEEARNAYREASKKHFGEFSIA